MEDVELAELGAALKDVPATNIEFIGSYNEKKEMHGDGKLIHKLDGQRCILMIEGHWIDGEIDGHCRVSIDGRTVYEGQWCYGFIKIGPDGNFLNLKEKENLKESLKEMKNDKDKVNVSSNSSGNGGYGDVDFDLQSLHVTTLEYMWTYSSDYLLHLSAPTTQVKDSTANHSHELRSQQRQNQIQKVLHTVVHNPSGPTDFVGYLRLVFIWFVMCIVLSKVIGGVA